MSNRKYLPTFAELIDRLSICMLKKIFIPENSSEYQEEIDLIKYDINLIMEEKDENDGMQLFDADMIEASMLIMLSNRFIWENESKARNGDSQDLSLLKVTHSINGIRNLAKNVISNSLGERKDLKLDCLAADLPKELGNWNYYKINKQLNITQRIVENIGIHEDYPGFQEHDALWFDEKEHMSYENLANEINKKIIIPKDIKTILELGCGAGSLAYHIRKINSNVDIFTLDGNPKTINSPYILSSNHFVVKTDNEYELVDEENNILKFDLILSFEHLEHIQKEMFHIFLENIKKHSHSKSLFLCTAANWGEADYGPHVNVKTEEEWHKYLEDNGFKMMTKKNYVNEKTKPFCFALEGTTELYFKIK